MKELVAAVTSLKSTFPGVIQVFKVIRLTARFTFFVKPDRLTAARAECPFLISHGSVICRDFLFVICS
jgi:hypothetical protein